MQIILGLFCIVVGATIIVMKRSSLIELLFGRHSVHYQKNPKPFESFVLGVRILSGIILALGLYICGTFLYYLWMGFD